jgi:hypothetical protein
VDRLIGIDLLRRGRQVRPGHRQPEQEHAQRAEGQQQQVAEPQDSAAAAHGLAQKVHGSPSHHLVPLPVQQVDQDRTGGGHQPGQGKPRG